MTINSRLVPTHDGNERTDFTWALDRDQLLAHPEIWGSAKGRLVSQPKVMEVLPLARDAMDGLLEVMRAVTDMNLDAAATKVDDLLTLLSDVADPIPAASRSSASGSRQTAPSRRSSSS